MTRDDIIRMAWHCDLGRVCGPLETMLDHEWEDLHRFADLAAAAEREECAKLCEAQYEYYGYDHVFAAKIRARGNK